MVRDRVTAVWAVLVTATVNSFLLGVEGSAGGHPLVSSLVIVIAMFKVRLVGLYFMGIRDAPVRLRGPFEGFCFVCCVVLLGFFLVH